MGKYFGTDGIRGKFNDHLRIDKVLNIAMAAAKVFKEDNENPIVCIGKDPRVSSNPIESALIAGLTAGGVTVETFGVIITPVISYMILKKKKYEAGIMVSASHNPYYDNGIKFFGKNGKKISDELEARLENAMDENDYNFNDELGKVIDNNDAKEDYINYLVEQGVDLSGVKVAIDGANGSSFEIGPRVFEKLGAEVVAIATEPNGININDNVGSTHPESLSKVVIANKTDYGFAFDGDGDRIILINEAGEELDGDYIIYLITKKLKEEKKLNNNISVGTVMANLGFKAALKELEIDFVETAVGDRFVMQKITELDASIGGEQSGHIILPDLLPTGDGVLTAVYLSKIFKENQEQLKNLKEEMKKYPQVLENVVVTDKEKVLNDETLLAAIKAEEEKLQDDGRILVRASGTEMLVRVMVEAKTMERCNEVAKPLVDIVKNI